MVSVLRAYRKASSALIHHHPLPSATVIGLFPACPNFHKINRTVTHRNSRRIGSLFAVSDALGLLVCGKRVCMSKWYSIMLQNIVVGHRVGLKSGAALAVPILDRRSFPP